MAPKLFQKDDDMSDAMCTDLGNLSLEVNENIALEESSHTSSSAATTTISVPDVDSNWDDASADLSSDLDLHGEPRETVISDYKASYYDLAALNRKVFENSGIGVYKSGHSSGLNDDHSFLHPPIVSSPLTGVDSAAIISLICSTKSEKLLHLLETYNLAVRAWYNLIYLGDLGFCGGSLSLLAIDQGRAGVAKIIQIEVQLILGLVKDIETILKASVTQTPQMQMAKATRESVNQYIEDQDKERHLTAGCYDLLQSMGLLPERLLNNEVWLNDGASVILQCAFQTLDLVILGYAGTHTQRFDLDFMDCDVESFQIPRKFTYHDERLRCIASVSSRENIIFRRRQLQCLDKLLGKRQPWVLHQDFSNTGNERLCLSTTIEALADLWGPSWRVPDNSRPWIKRFNIGNGAIVPWPANNGGQGLDIKPSYSEIFCHWIASSDWNDSEVELHQSSLRRRYFLESDTLLIGASTDVGLLVNKNCTSSVLFK